MCALWRREIGGTVTDNESSDEKAITPSPPTHITLGSTTQVDLSGLPEVVRIELMQSYAQGRIDLARKAEELGIEVRALDETLKTMVDTTKNVSESGDAVTISHVQDSSVGRTEIIMGNTAQAESGKLTKSQTGERDWTPYYIGGGLIAIVLIALAVASG